MLCIKNRVPANLSYHCSGECLRAHWPLHRNYHARYQAQAQYISNGGATRRIFFPSLRGDEIQGMRTDLVDTVM